MAASVKLLDFYVLWWWFSKESTDLRWHELSATPDRRRGSMSKQRINHVTTLVASSGYQQKRHLAFPLFYLFHPFHSFHLLQLFTYIYIFN